MKPLSIASALLAVASSALAATAASSSKDSQPAQFKPPQVFRNANLVHIISLEKNYAKEQINVLIENVSNEPQSEYYIPFTEEQIARVGGFEVKDRKNANAGPFVSEAVEYDPNSDTQYYRIHLPTPLKAGGQQTLGISFYNLKAYRPLPASIKQDDKQYLAASSTIPDYTKITEGKEELPQKQGAKLIYGPFGEKPAGAISPAQVRFEFTKPVTHVSTLERDIEVSHWGGNIAFEERYALHHRGANLSSPFNRVKYAQSAFFNPASTALKELRVPLQVGSVDPYFTDVIGNVSTSQFRSNKREALLELKPRYPLSVAGTIPSPLAGTRMLPTFSARLQLVAMFLKVPFLEGPRQAEGIEYGQVIIRVVLPEGARNVKYYTGIIPESSVVETSVSVHKTYPRHPGPHLGDNQGTEPG
ncbi:dolichyl-diphosphooligosaccharide--protein glycosyltransferase subunit 1 [Metarhizium acridum]|nr:dolichyl-diphosphooligosaccharide--protein glycosyltransferase subunit 1 [Metarhizium acridum]